MENDILHLDSFIEKLIDYKFFNKELKLNDSDASYLCRKFNPTIIINSYTKEDLESHLEKLKQQFIEANGVFDYHIFKRNEIAFIKMHVAEYHALTPKSKNQGKLEKYNLFQIQTDIDRNSNCDTLLLSEKNAIQLELHFKMILDTLEEFELENTTKNEPNTKEFNWMKVVPLFTEGIIYNERNKKNATSFTKIIKENLQTSREEADKLRPYVSETFNNHNKPKNDKNLCLPDKAKIIKNQYEIQLIDSRFIEEINKASKYQEY